MVIVRWTDSAREDLGVIFEYLWRDSPSYAQELTEHLLSAADTLARFPLIGRKVPEYDSEGIREVLHDAYRLIYSLDAEVVDILAVVHGRRDLKTEYPKERFIVD